jgi:drug/metabolite transporter (DMT)-like permease
VLGILVSLGSALAFSLSNVSVRRGVLKAPVSHGTFVTVLMGVPLFLLACLVSGQILHVADLSAKEYSLLAAAGIVHYVFGRYFNYAGIEAIGAARSGPINALNLPWSVMMAWLFLGEDMSLGVIIGIVLALIGPLLMFERRAPAPQAVAITTVSDGDAVTDAPAPVEVVRIRQMEGYLFAVLCAIGYGTSPVLIRSALEGHSGVSILGGFTAYTAAAALLIASLVLPSRRGLVAALNVQTMRAFFAAGFFVFLAQMLNFIALTLASVAVVATLLRFSNVFTLMISWVYNRRLEMITPRTVLGVSFSVTGAIVMVFA